MNQIADNAPQTPKNAASARLTCVMCGGDNALDATQCEHCGAALRPAIPAAQVGAAQVDASTRAPLFAAASHRETQNAAKTDAAESRSLQNAAATPSAAPDAASVFRPGRALVDGIDDPLAASAATRRESEAAPTAASRVQRTPQQATKTTNDAAKTTPLKSDDAAPPVTFSFASLDAAPETESVSSASAHLTAAQDTGKAAANPQTPIAAAPPNAASTRDAAATRAARDAHASEEVRAQALLDRAFRLAEIGDTDAAILACSEAAALQPGSAAPPSMLALLLERTGDTAGAITAYRRALKVSPENRAARDSLARLQATTGNLSTAAAVQTSAATSLAPSAEASRVAREYSQDVADAPRTDAPRTTASKGVTVASPTTSDAAAPAAVNTPVVAPLRNSTVGIAPEARATDAVSATLAPVPTRAANAAIAPVSAGANAAPLTASTRGDGGLESATQDDISALSQFLQDISAPSAAATSDAASVPALSVTAPKTRAAAPPRRVATRRDSYFLRSLPLAATALLGIWFLWGSRRASPMVASTREVPTTPTPVAATPIATATKTAPPQTQSVQEQLAAAVAAAQAAPKNIAPTATPFRSAATPIATPTVGATPAMSATPFTPPILPPATTGAVSPPTANNGAVPMLPPQNATPAGDSTNFERASQLQQRALASLEAGDNAAAARGFGSAIEAYNAQIATGFRGDEARSAIAACRDGVRLAQQMQNRAAPPR